MLLVVLLCLLPLLACASAPPTCAAGSCSPSDLALSKLRASVAAWDDGFGAWPQLSPSARIEAVESLLADLQARRAELAKALMEDIHKNCEDAEAEVDRTLEFCRLAIEEVRSGWGTSPATDLYPGLLSHARRAGLGVVLVLGPSNYPLNEAYAMLIPAILTGNTAVFKVPAVGELVHGLTYDLFERHLPPGTVSFVRGGGRETCPPMMASGLLAGLGFIGSAQAADALIAAHPRPHRLKVFSQLEAKNVGLAHRSLFEAGSEELLERAVGSLVAGALSYNGQRCTAIKQIFVPREHAAAFLELFAAAVSALRAGPADANAAGRGEVSQITPLPRAKDVARMRALIDDAVAAGAAVVNERGGEVLPDASGTLLAPAVLFPVAEGMRLWREEQFGPVVSVAPYDDLGEVERYVKGSEYAQQISLFASSSPAASADVVSLVDKFHAVLGKINLNAPPGRSPDTMPFSGRRSSAMGTMSVLHALEAFTVETVVVAGKGEGKEADGELFGRVMEESTFASK
ncbi:hypothetical protein TeGR_g2948 [Tetraparma gracilis]|uniref:Succinate-semialdehyde dehydrogenase, mitochondrial n=1 Tax=Tetraparma gracilis TaxID=2962635 RepID=A0ABQ6MRH8_9STRA|nr:hypothetical protein TeGR_g2948 [Tetraparma gracilis]